MLYRIGKPSIIQLDIILFYKYFEAPSAPGCNLNMIVRRTGQNKKIKFLIKIVNKP